MVQYLLGTIVANSCPRLCPSALPTMCTILVQYKSFRCNTYVPPRMCCKQKTCAILKSFRCNIYKKQGAQGERYCRSSSRCVRYLRRNPGSLESIVYEMQFCKPFVLIFI